MKVSIIGAGNVGATAALAICENEFVDEIVLLDVREGVAEGKAMDIMQANYAAGRETKVYGVTNDYTATECSDVIVITSGVPRKPGMTREELVGVNSGVMKQVLEGCAPYSQAAVYVIVSNPMDTMTLLAHKFLNSEYGIPHSRIIGMGGRLDTARFNFYLEKAVKEAGFDPENLATIDEAGIRVLGGHGDTTMVPITSNIVYVKSEEEDGLVSIKDLLGDDVLNKVVADTMKGGATMTGLLGTSAWVAPAQAIAETVQDIISGSMYAYPCSVYDPDLDLCIGTDAVLGPNGVEFAAKYELSDDERAAIKASIEAVRKVNTSITL